MSAVQLPEAPLAEPSREARVPADAPAVTGPSEELLRRIQGEYLEMAGLKLTLPQAARLMGLDRGLCLVALGVLVGRGFLRVTADGSYARSEGGR